MTKISSDRKDLLKARYEIHKQRAALRSSVTTAGVRSVIRQPKPVKQSTDESALDKAMPLVPSEDNHRDGPSLYGPIRRTIAWLYSLDLEEVRMNYRLTRIHSRLSHELFVATGKRFTTWPNMTVEDLSRNYE